MAGVGDGNGVTEIGAVIDVACDGTTGCAELSTEIESNEDVASNDESDDGTSEIRSSIRSVRRKLNRMMGCLHAQLRTKLAEQRQSFSGLVYHT